jgi:hypothetical protein
MTQNRSIYVAAAALVAAVGSAASAQTLIDFSYNSASASYNTGSSTLTASAVNSGAIQTSGFVRRFLPTASSANFLPGSANFNLSLAVSGVTPTSATGVGSLTLTDANGDTITAAVNGTFFNGGSAVFFNGFLGNIALNNNSSDGNFDGASGGSFSLNTSGYAPLSGSLVYLELGNAGNFFTSSFATTVTQVSGAIIPAPSALALAALAAPFARRNRRR